MLAACSTKEIPFYSLNRTTHRVHNFHGQTRCNFIHKSEFEISSLFRWKAEKKTIRFEMKFSVTRNNTESATLVQFAVAGLNEAWKCAWLIDFVSPLESIKIDLGVKMTHRNGRVLRTGSGEADGRRGIGTIYKQFMWHVIPCNRCHALGNEHTQMNWRLSIILLLLQLMIHAPIHGRDVLLLCAGVPLFHPLRWAKLN